MLLTTTSGRYGTTGASAASTPISCRTRSAAGRDQANLATNSVPMNALDDHHCGSSPAPVSPGITIGYPASSGATSRSAPASAAAEPSASHLTPTRYARRGPGYPAADSAGRL